MTPQTINAYYNPLNNEIVFPAAILQPPFFDPNADAAVNYGGIGAVIGHEIGHGFDDQGRKFGPDGSLKDWWTQKDADVFKGRVTRLVNQFSAFEALPGLKVNGANTIGENIGDLGGLNMAYHAYHLSLKGKPAPVIDGLTGDQRFFLSWAQVWRAKYPRRPLRELRDVGRAQSRGLPCERTASEHRRVVQRVQCSPGRQALYQARGSRLDLVGTCAAGRAMAHGTFVPCAIAVSVLRDSRPPRPSGTARSATVVSCGRGSWPRRPSARSATCGGSARRSVARFPASAARNSRTTP